MGGHPAVFALAAAAPPAAEGRVRADATASQEEAHEAAAERWVEGAEHGRVDTGAVAAIDGAMTCESACLMAKVLQVQARRASCRSEDVGAL